MIENNNMNINEFLSNQYMIMIISSIFAIIVSVIVLVSIGKVFKKAGKSGILAIVPIYNIIVMMEISKMPYTQLLFILIPIIGPFIYMYKLYSNLSKVFGKSNGFAWGLFFFGFVFFPLLAFSDDMYLNQTSEVTNHNVKLNAMDIINANNQDINNTILPQSNVTEIIPVQPIDDYHEQANINIEPIIDTTSVNPIEQVGIQQQSNVFNQTPSMENVNINPIEQVEPQEEPNAFNQTPYMENVNINPIEQVEPQEEPNAFNQTPSTENININPIEQVEPQEQPNAFNQTPSTENINVNPIEQVEPQEEPNAFNQTPSMENININPIEQVEPQEQIIESLPPIDNQLTGTDNKNLCRNCGAEMPTIVTICPKCGIDNE